MAAKKSFLEKIGCESGEYTKASLNRRSKFLLKNIEKGVYSGKILARAKSYAAKYKHLAKNFEQ